MCLAAAAPVPARLPLTPSPPLGHPQPPQCVQTLEAAARLLRRERRRVHAAWDAAAPAPGGLAPGSALREDLEAALATLSHTFWHLTQLKPRLMMAWLFAALPPASLDMGPRWTQAAQDSLLLLSGEELAQLRAAWGRYTQRMAAAAESVRPVAGCLAALSTPTSEELALTWPVAGSPPPADAEPPQHEVRRPRGHRQPACHAQPPALAACPSLSHASTHAVGACLPPLLCRWARWPAACMWRASSST